MTQNRAHLNWRVTRFLFALGAIAIATGAFRLVSTSSLTYLWVILGGLIALAVATRGPWDSEESGRNRSVLGFHARP